MRPAAPSERGRCRANFSRASRESAGRGVKRSPRATPCPRGPRRARSRRSWRRRALELQIDLDASAIAASRRGRDGATSRRPISGRRSASATVERCDRGVRPAACAAHPLEPASSAARRSAKASKSRPRTAIRVRVRAARGAGRRCRAATARDIPPARSASDTVRRRPCVTKSSISTPMYASLRPARSGSALRARAPR